MRLLERAGRGVRLTDPALMLVDHADALLERAALAEADLAAAVSTVAGRGRVAGFQSVALRLALPAIEALARDSPRLRCELIEAEPEQALPALALGDLDLVLGDEWPHQPWQLPHSLWPTNYSKIRWAPPARQPSGGGTPPRRGATRRARRRGLVDRSCRDGLGGDDPADLPRAWWL